MTTRLIEKCFDIEEIEGTYHNISVFVVDPRILSKKEILKLQNSEPGRIIRMRSVGMKHIHYLNYRGVLR